MINGFSSFVTEKPGQHTVHRFTHNPTVDSRWTLSDEQCPTAINILVHTIQCTVIWVLSACRERRMKSSRPKLEVGAQRAPRLFVCKSSSQLTGFQADCSLELTLLGCSCSSWIKVTITRQTCAPQVPEQPYHFFSQKIRTVTFCKPTNYHLNSRTRLNRC